MYRLFVLFPAFLALALCAGCGGARRAASPPSPKPAEHAPALVHEVGGFRKIHVFVPLCDNANQGIVPVPAGVGNGQDPAGNLYWGARYGVKTFLKHSSEWKLLREERNPKEHVLERVVFLNKAKKAYLVADAYDGAKMREALIDLLTASAGMTPEVVEIDGNQYLFGGGANLLAFVGHDGLMDMELDLQLTPSAKPKKDVLIFSCASSSYFEPWMRKANANPLIWTTGLMCPEAYTLHAALAGWLNKETPADIHEQVARAYDKYQHCGMRASRRLFKTGW